MTAGDLRDRVLWQKPIRTDNAAGQAVVSWQDVDTTWAKVEPVRAGGTTGEADRHSQLTPDRGYTITFRGRTLADGTVVPVDPQEDWRAVWVSRGRTFEVKAVSPHPNGGEYMLAMCRERPPSTTA